MQDKPEDKLGSMVRILGALALVAALWAPAPAPAQEPDGARVTVSQTLFSVLAAINHCGYDHELNLSDPLRAQVRDDVARAATATAAARLARDQVCAFYLDHQQSDPARELAQYVSLALNLGEPPEFELALRAADLPPDAAYVLGLAPLLQRFHREAGLGEIWQRHQARYEALADQAYRPVAQLLEATDIYLRMPAGASPGRRFLVYIDPLGAPGQVNARNYASDYVVVASPVEGNFRLDPVRHTYLHYVLDPLLARRGSAARRMEPLLRQVYDAPMDRVFKQDIALLMAESIIRAIEARLLGGEGRAGERLREAAVEDAMAEGYVLTHHFAEQLKRFERGEQGFQTALPDMLYVMSLPAEQRRASRVRFAAGATPEVLSASNRRETQLLELAEERLATGDGDGARTLAQQALEERSADAGRAHFILARAATAEGNMQAARHHFEQALEHAREARLLAWSHIYLGRIMDLMQERGKALEHYRAALSAGGSLPETRAAAERGLQQPYAVPRPPQD